MKKNVRDYWTKSESSGDLSKGMYLTVERNRQPLLRAMLGAFFPVYKTHLPEKGKILVQGAGRGFERLIIPQSIRSSRLVFNDLSEDAIKALKHLQPNAEAHIGSSFNLPYRSNTFTAVTSLDHLDVFHENHLPTVVAENLRVLKPGGVMLVNQSSVPSLHWSEEEKKIVAQLAHEEPITEKQAKETHEAYSTALMKAMREGGFEDVRKESVHYACVGPVESRHQPAMLKVIPPGHVPALIGINGKLDRSLLDDGALRSLNVPSSRQLRATYGNPVMEVFGSYSIHGRKPRK